jgi:hypothetical protein
MTLSRRLTIILACTAAAAVAAPGAAMAAKNKKHHAHRAAAPPQPTVVVPHIYDAGGDGGEIRTPAGVSVRIFNPLDVATGLGNKLLGDLGLPPL